MKIIGVSASARKSRSTHFLLAQCLDEVGLTTDAAGKPIETELIDLAPLKIKGCISCDVCIKAAASLKPENYIGISRIGNEQPTPIWG